MAREYIDFGALRERISFADVLSRYGIRLRAAGRDQLRGKCPLPTHSSKESRDSFFVNTAKNVWCCHSDSCKKASGRDGGNVLEFVAAMQRCDVRGAAETLSGWFPGSGGPEKETNQNAPPRAERNGTEVRTRDNSAAGPTKNRPLAERYPGFAKLKDVNPEHPMIQGKGISVETARGFGIGFFPGKGSMAGRIVFEMLENGELVGYAGRLVEGEGPKWKLPAGLIKSFVYGLERCDPKYPLILGESFWLPAFMRENGKQAASLMGSEMTELQEECLKPFGVIWLAFDSDEAGRKKAAPIRERLQGNHAVKVTFLKE